MSLNPHFYYIRKKTDNKESVSGFFSKDNFPDCRVEFKMVAVGDCIDSMKPYIAVCANCGSQSLKVKATTDDEYIAICANCGSENLKRGPTVDDES